MVYQFGIPATKRMPLIVITGIPSSGKSTRTSELTKYFSSLGKVVHVVSEEEQILKAGFSKNSIYFGENWLFIQRNRNECIVLFFRFFKRKTYSWCVKVWGVKTGYFRKCRDLGWFELYKRLVFWYKLNLVLIYICRLK